MTGGLVVGGDADRLADSDLDRIADVLGSDLGARTRDHGTVIAAVDTAQMAERDGDTGAFDACIHNLKELEERAGKRFANDSAALLHLVREDVDGLARVDGWFAGAAVVDGNVVFVRDALGGRNLFYHASEPVFATDVRGVALAPGVKRRPDPDAVRDYLMSGMVQGTRTMFAGVRKLAPGTLHGDETHRFWEPTYPGTRRGAAAGKRLVELLSDAIAARLDTHDGSVGVALSGGFDSSTVLALLRENTDQDVTGYTLGPTTANRFTEFDRAGRIASRFDAGHETVRLEPDDIREAPRAVWELGEPCQHISSTVNHVFQRRVDADVLFTGVGGESVFFYSGHVAARRMAQLRRLPDAVLAMLAAAGGGSGSPISIDSSWRAFLSKGPAEARRPASELVHRLTPPCVDLDEAGIAVPGSTARPRRDGPLVPRYVRHRFAEKLPNYHLRGFHRAGPADTAFVAPVASRPLVDAVRDVDVRTMLRGGEKGLMKHAMRARLRDAYATGDEKISFSQSVLGPWQEHNADLIRQELDDLADRDVVTGSLERHIGGDRIHDTGLTYLLFTLELWFKTFVDGDGSRPGLLDG